jgi:putative acetyltransferase
MSDAGGMTLRPATNSDCGAVRDLVFHVLAEYGLSPDPETTDADLANIEASYQASGGLFDVITDDAGGIVGTVGLYPLDGATCELRKMYLHASCRGQGWGRRLLKHALARAKVLGFTRVTLETASVLREAIALYERYGFRKHEAGHLSERCDQAYYLDL